jgi:hypothetical protein
MKRISLVRPFGAFLTVLSLSGTLRGQPLFSDNFDTDTSAQWTVFNGSDDGTPDRTVQFAFDYSTTRYVANGLTNFIPPAPNSTGGTTRGVKLTVNKDDNAAAAAISLYPVGMTFSNNYALRADMWINYNGPAFGGTGSTEFGTFGINHVGDKVNWFDADAATQPVSDGVWFAVAGQAGAGINTITDYDAYVGDGASSAHWLRTTEGGFLDRDGDGNLEIEVNPLQANTYPLKLLFPSPQFETPGAPGKQWVQVEVRQHTNGTGSPVVTWLINGYVIAEHAQGVAFGQTAGNIMIGTMAPFSAIASPKEDSFLIFDNVRVVNLDLEPPHPVVSITSTDTTAAEPGTDTASFTIARSGDTTAPLTVALRISGTAANGVDYAALPTSVTLPAGVPATNIVVTPLNDSASEPTETIIVTLTGSSQYDVRAAAFVRIDLADDGDVSLTAVQVAGGNVQIDFSGATGDPTSAFTLQSSADVAGGYASEPGANISRLSPGLFRATATLNGPIRFYRIQR